MLVQRAAVDVLQAEEGLALVLADLVDLEGSFPKSGAVGSLRGYCSGGAGA
jgi:hypothetical protein